MTTPPTPTDSSRPASTASALRGTAPVRCARCEVLIGRRRAHWLLRDGLVVCSACVSEPVELGPSVRQGRQKIGPPSALDLVVIGGSRQAVVDYLAEQGRASDRA